MRIIAGKHKGRRIELGKEQVGIRPTSEFAREAIFNILMHGRIGKEHPFTGKRVLDVCCGTGALGLEALSRGASQVTFIDQSREALMAAHVNAERMGELDSVDFIQTDATKLARARAPFALVFIDPPYFSKLLEPILASLHKGGWIDGESLLVVEHDSKEQVAIPPAFHMEDERRYGRATVRLLRLA